MGLTALILGRLTQTLADPDLWGYLAFGRQFWILDGFPYADIFAYTPTKPLWVYHEWLTGVIFYPIYQFLGAAGLQLFKYAIGLGTALLIYKTARLRGASPGASAACLLLISPFFSFAYSPVRAQVFTNLFLVLTMLILEKSRQNRDSRLLWWLIPIFLLWANFHGGFVAGLGIIGLFATGETLSRSKSIPLWLILIPATLITLLNPYGLQYWIYLKDALLMPRPDISEWHSLFFALQSGDLSPNILVFLILFVLAVLMFFASRSCRLSDIFLILATSFLAFQHVRHQSLFFIMMGCLAPLYFTGAWNNFRQFANQIERWKKAFHVLTPVLFCCLFIFFGFRFMTGQPLDLTLRNTSPGQTSEDNYPAGAVHFIKQHKLRGNILPEFNWGEYILWSLPDSRVAIDGRYETVYTEKPSKEYFAFNRGTTGWREYLNQYPHDMVLFRPESFIGQAMRTLPDWRLVYSDADGILFMRQSSAAAKQISKD
jgi:hypothetical protein